MHVPIYLDIRPHLGSPGEGCGEALSHPVTWKRCRASWRGCGGRCAIYIGSGVLIQGTETKFEAGILFVKGNYLVRH